MDTKEESVKILNKIITNQGINPSELIPFILEYLTDINVENPEKEISLMQTNPYRIASYWEQVTKHLVNKYCICNILDKNRQPIYYYYATN